MIDNPIVFFIASSILILFAIYSLFLKKIIYCLLSAIMVFFSSAIIFYLLGSEYNAIIQTAIYGLAVPIIIGISVMFTTGISEQKKLSKISYISLISGIIFVLAFLYILKRSLTMLSGTFQISNSAQISFYDVITAFTNGIYIKYVWAFEVVSLLLVIIIAGFSVLNKKEHF